MSIPEEEDNINSIISFLTIFRKNILLIFIIPILFTSISIVLLYFTPNTYKSTSTFLPPPADMILDYSDDISSLSLSGAPISLGKSFNSFFKNPGQVYIEILSSKYISEYIIKKYNLQQEFKDKYIEDTIVRMDKIISIKDNSGLIEISAETKDAKLSANIVNSCIDRLSELLDKLVAKKTTTFLEKRLNEVHDNLVKSSNNLKNFQLDNKIIDVKKQSEGIIESLVTLQTQIIVAESELKSLKEVYTENSIKIKSVMAKVDNLKKQLSELQKVTSPSTINEYPTDVKLLDIPTVGLNYATLYRDNSILEQVYILLTKQYELAKIKESRENINLKIIDQASIATKKSGPKKTLIAIFTLILSLLTSVFIIIYKFLIFNFNKNYPNEYDQIKRIFFAKNI